MVHTSKEVLKSVVASIKESVMHGGLGMALVSF